MIFDKVENLSKYEIGFLSPVIDYLKDVDLKTAPCGFSELDGKNLTISVVDRILDKEATVWEVHEKYIDVHVMIAGNEQVSFASEEDLKKTQDYKEEKDCALFEGNPDNRISYKLSAGDAMIFLPGEVHLTNGPCNGDSAKKAIFKVLFKS